MENKEKNIPKKKKSKMQLEKNERQNISKYAEKYEIFIDDTALLSGFFVEFWKECLHSGVVMLILETSMREMKRKAELDPKQYEEEYCKVVSILYQEYKEIDPKERIFIVIKGDNGMDDLRMYNNVGNGNVLFITQDKAKMECAAKWAKEDDFSMKVVTLLDDGYVKEVSIIEDDEDDEESMLAALSKNELDNIDGNKKKLNHSWKTGI